MSHANNDTYYAKATAVATAGGKVYISDKAATPDYQETSGPVSASASSADVPFYLYAQPDAGKVFDRWERDGATVSNAAEYTATVTSSSKDQASPVEAVFTAYFRDRAAVELVPGNIPGTASISKTDNVVGDVVTLKYVLPRIPAYGCKNLMIAFEGWQDQDGVILSTDSEYTFEIKESATISPIVVNKASYKAEGYYRIRNAFNRTLAVIGNFKYSTKSSANFVDGLLRWVFPEDYVAADFANKVWNGSDDDPGVDVESMPSTVIYATGSNLNPDAGPESAILSKVDLSAQGVKISDVVSGATFTLKNESATSPGYAYLDAGLASFKMTHQEQDETLPDGTKVHRLYCRPMIGSPGANAYRSMAVQPIDEEHFDDFWFGAAASEEMLFEGGYWTSMYTAFPYECRDGVEAYYVREATTVSGEQYALLERIEGDRVPANTPVLLKCQGLKSRQNRLLPLLPSQATDIPAVEGNLLVGEFSLNTSITYQSREAANFLYTVAGRPEFNPDYMRVLSVNTAGEVGFYSLPPEEDGSQPKLAPNKVWLDMRSLPARSAVVRLSTGGKSGIHEYPVADGDGYESADADNTVYDLYGRRVANPQPGTLYIVGGKKTVFK